MGNLECYFCGENNADFCKICNKDYCEKCHKESEETIQNHSEYLSYHQYYEMEFLGVKA